MLVFLALLTWKCAVPDIYIKYSFGWYGTRESPVETGGKGLRGPGIFLNGGRLFEMSDALQGC